MTGGFLIWGLLAMAWFAVFVLIVIGAIDDGPPDWLDGERVDDEE